MKIDTGDNQTLQAVIVGQEKIHPAFGGAGQVDGVGRSDGVSRPYVGVARRGIHVKRQTLEPYPK